jgi:hypothetical protein
MDLLLLDVRVDRGAAASENLAGGELELDLALVATRPAFRSDSLLRFALRAASIPWKAHMDSTQQPVEGNGHPGPAVGLLSILSNEMVRLYKENFGRGPTKVAAA